MTQRVLVKPAKGNDPEKDCEVHNLHGRPLLRAVVDGLKRPKGINLCKHCVGRVRSTREHLKAQDEEPGK